jgi:hypothetical protein
MNLTLYTRRYYDTTDHNRIETNEQLKKAIREMQRQKDYLVYLFIGEKDSVLVDSMYPLTDFIFLYDEDKNRYEISINSVSSILLTEKDHEHEFHIFCSH